MTVCSKHTVYPHKTGDSHKELSQTTGPLNNPWIVSCSICLCTPTAVLCLSGGAWKKSNRHTHHFLSFLKLMDWVSVNITELCPFIHSRSINREGRWLMSRFNPSGSYRERNVLCGLPCVNKHTLRLHIKLVFLTKAVQNPKQKTNHIPCMYMFEDIKTNICSFKMRSPVRCI